MKSKTCTVCRKSKPIARFYASQVLPSGKRRGDGLRMVCKDCCNAKKRGWIAAMSPSQKTEYLRRKNEQTRIWHKNHPLTVKANHANLHARRVGAAGTVSVRDVESAWQKWGGKCWVCGSVADEVDHFRPINNGAGGTNTADNIRPICRECNQKRSHQWHGEQVAMKEAELLKRIKNLLREAGGL